MQIAVKPYDPLLHLHPREKCSVPLCGGTPAFSCLFRSRTDKLTTRAVCEEHERHYFPVARQGIANHDWLVAWGECANGSATSHEGDGE